VIDLRLGDCLDVLPTLPDASVDLILTDPPYFSTGKAAVGDRQWRTADAYLDWLGALCVQWRRVLKPNGSLYCFASPAMAARVEVRIASYFDVLTRITWRKDAGWHKGSCKADMRSYFPASEAIIFAEQRGADSMALGESGYAASCERLHGFVFEPLRSWFQSELRNSGMTFKDVNTALGLASGGGGMASHYFGKSYQWELPTREHYQRLQRVLNTAGGDYLRREYEDLRREYEDLRREYENLRRPFAVTAEVPYTDVWDFPTVGFYPGKHPCEKPAPLLRHIVTTSTRPGGVALDCFLGSGATAIACLDTGRDCIGVEKNTRYFGQAWANVATAQTRIAAVQYPLIALTA